MRWVFLLMSAVFCLRAGAEAVFPPMYPEKGVFEAALNKAPRLPDEGRRITGIVVPHHLLAADLIARGFRCAEHGRYQRVIVLSPDHFRRSATPVSTTLRGFETVWGTVECDETGVRSLLGSHPGAALSDLFDREHGVHALTPFIARFFPGAKLVPVAIRIDSKPEDWRKLADALLPLVEPGTLIVQSTDFSHYLPAAAARRKDQRMLDVLATGDAERIFGLEQPAHLDSKAAQYVHMVLQKRVHGAVPVVIENRNSEKYARTSAGSTTSYIVQVFEAGEAAAAWDGGESWFFAGDVFFGRYVARRLAEPEAGKALRERILAITKGRPMGVNLEGVIVREPPRRLIQNPMVMEKEMTLEWLRELNVKVAGLANNHAHDRGAEGLAETMEALEGVGIQPLEEGRIFDAGRFRVAALTDLCNKRMPGNGRISHAGIGGMLGRDGAKAPVFVMLHAGKEFRREPDERRSEIFDWLAEPLVSEGEEIRMMPSPVALVLGAHPHVAGGPPRIVESTVVVDSLGNFIFDQPQGEGALVEVRFFEQGTHAVRWIPVGNLLTRKR